MYLMDANCINQHLYCIQFILNSSLSHEVLSKAQVNYKICSQKCNLSVCVRLILTGNDVVPMLYPLLYLQNTQLLSILNLCPGNGICVK